jgi:hypothetical protein
LSSRLSSKNVKIIVSKTVFYLYLAVHVRLGLSREGRIRLRVLENRVLRRIFGSKRVEFTGGWRGLHIEDLYGFCSSNTIRANKSRIMLRAEHTGEMRNAYRILSEKPLGRPRRRWEKNIKINFK